MYTNRKHKLLKISAFLLISFCILFILFPSKENQNNIDEIFFKTISIEITDITNSKYYGTGLLYDNSNIITVSHLFPGGSENIKSIKMTNGELDFEFEDIQKINPELDLALISIKNKDFKIDSSLYEKSLNYGDEIRFFGNTNGYGLTYKEGLIAKPVSTMKYQGKERRVFFISNSVNKGESGSPVFNKSNELIGILSFKMNDSLGNEINEFSAIIPVESIMRFLETDN